MVKIVKETKRVVKNSLYASDHFREMARKYPNKVAVVLEDRKMTFKELDEISNRIANYLRSLH